MTSTGPAQDRAGAWRTATVRTVTHPTDHAVVLQLAVPDRVPHLPGQHYVIRLTAEDGYVAQRSYSIASAPADPLLEFFIERLPDGEVSTFLADVLAVGDTLDIRGPIGGWFVWDGASPAIGVAGGSGAVPLVAMLRHAKHTGVPDRLRLVVSAQSSDRVPYLSELFAAKATIRLTSRPVDGHSSTRLNQSDLAPLIDDAELAYVCGSAAFSGAAVTWLQQLDFPDTHIRVESFGPSG